MINSVFTFSDIIVGFVLPAVVCAAILVAAWQPWRRESARDGRWAGAIAIGAAYASAYARLVGDFQFPPSSADNWIVYLMPVAMVLGVLFCRLPRAPWVRLGAVAAACVALVWLLLKPLIGSEFSTADAACHIAAGAVAMTLWWLLLNQLARSGPRMLAPVILFFMAAGAAAILADSGLAVRGGFPLGALALALVTAAIIAAITPRFSLAGGGTLATTLVLFGTMIYAYFYIAEPTPRLTAALAIVLASPALAAVIWLPGLRRRPSWQRGVLGSAVVLLAVAVAVALVELHPAPSESQDATTL